MRVEGYRGQLTAEHLLLMGVPRRFWEVDFDHIDPSTQGTIRRYLANLDEMLSRGEGMLLWGENGRGKTSAAVYVAKEVRRTGASVLMVSAASLMESVLGKIEDDDEDGKLLDRAKLVDFLVLDDLGKEHSSKSGYSDSVFENLLRERGSNRLTTWITSNMGPPGLAGRYRVSLLEVLKELVMPVHVQGKNQRDETRDRLTRLAAG